MCWAGGDPFGRRASLAALGELRLVADDRAAALPCSPASSAARVAAHPQTLATGPLRPAWARYASDVVYRDGARCGILGLCAGP